tara:strand:+ start:3598 stop:3921 length:324 start_codon:yes stop_codon:yes gene_type:complete
MVIEYSIGDTSPAIEIEIENYDLTGCSLKFAIGFTAGSKEFDLTLDADPTTGKASGTFPAPPAPGDPPFLNESGKFPAEIQLVTSAGLIETFRGFYVRVYEQLATNP